MKITAFILAAVVATIIVAFARLPKQESQPVNQEINQLLSEQTTVVIYSRVSRIKLATLTVPATNDPALALINWCQTNGPILISDLDWVILKN